jgi:excisionase family DNA binding protein
MAEQVVTINFPLSEFEEIQKGWIKEVLKEFTPSSPKEQEILTRKETSALLGISLVTLNEYTKSGKIPGYRLGSRIRYKKHEVLNALNGIKKYER